MFERIILHIGTEKTATSSIQYFLSMNRNALAKEGIIYPKIKDSDGGSQEAFVLAGEAASPRIRAKFGLESDTDVTRFLEELASAVEKQASEAAPKTRALLISSEHFHSVLYKNTQLENLRNYLSRWTDNIAIVVYFRRQDLLATSRYMTQLKSGQLPISCFPDLSNPLVYHYFCHEQVYGLWSSVFGEQAIAAGLFERDEWSGRNILQDFCLKVGVSTADKKSPPFINQSLDQAGIAYFLSLNRYWDHSKQRICGIQRRSVTHLISTRFAGKHPVCTKADARAFLYKFSESNLRLQQLILPHKRDQLFVQNFDMYPQICHPVRPASRLELVLLLVRLLPVLITRISCKLTARMSNLFR